MQKVLVVSVTLFLLTESSPVNHNAFNFDKLDMDLSKLSYSNEEDLDDFSKLLDEDADISKSNKAKSNVESSGFKKKNALKKSEKKNYDIEDLKKFFNKASAHDAGTHDNGDLYAFIKRLAAQAVGITGNEDRTYKKGTKTRGYHKVLHKDEYKKDKEFYEDNETSGVIKKVGAKGIGVDFGGGAGYDKGYFHRDHDKRLYGKRDFSDKGSEDKNYNELLDSQGFDAYFQSETK